MLQRGRFDIIAGPCAVEKETYQKTVDFLLDLGVSHIRGNIFKPRTWSHAFQGVGQQGVLELEAARGKGAKIVAEAISSEHLEVLRTRADVIQIGARNMYNYPFLTEVGKTKVPVLLKRAPSATVEEVLGAASYLKDTQVALCERGIRCFNTETRFTLDLANAVLARSRSELPVIADPSHGTGLRELVGPMCMAALASGLDGVMVEVHPDPEKSQSDPQQTLDFKAFEELLGKLESLANALGTPFLGC
jgi:3-deoxy-7-phosphoheptulonate synthase